MTKEEINDLEQEVVHLRFKMKRALYEDRLHDADRYSSELGEKKRELDSYKTRVTITVNVPDHVHDLFMRLRSYMVTRGDEFSIGDSQLIQDIQKHLENERVKARKTGEV